MRCFIEEKGQLGARKTFNPSESKTCLEARDGTKGWPKLAAADLIPCPEGNNSCSSREDIRADNDGIGRGGECNSESAGEPPVRRRGDTVDTRQDSEGVCVGRCAGQTTAFVSLSGDLASWWAWNLCRKEENIISGLFGRDSVDASFAQPCQLSRSFPSLPSDLLILRPPPLPPLRFLTFVCVCVGKRQPLFYMLVLFDSA